jgi:hypothetical protein
MGETEKIQQEVLAAAVKQACEAMEQAEIVIAHLRVEVDYWKARALGLNND